MRNDITTANLTAASMLLPYFDECQKAANFVYLLQLHSLRGCDVSIWYIDSDGGSYFNIVLGTGPIAIDMSAVRSHLSSMTTENGQPATVAKMSSLTSDTQKNIRLQIETHQLISREEFKAVASIVQQIKPGESQLLGTDREFRVVAKLASGAIDVCSEDGLHDVETRWLFYELLRKVHLDTIPPQLVGISVF